jgi:tetratricopeptide (TPR) repeat protein
MFYIREKKYDKAIESFNTLEKVTGFNEDLIIQKKNIYVSQGKTELAIAELQKLKEAYPASAEYPIMMIDVYNETNQKEKTKTIYQVLEKDYSSDPHAQVVLAEYYTQQKNTKRANEYMMEVMKNKNLDAETKIRLLVPSLKILESDSTEDRERILGMAKTIADESPDNKDALGLYGDLLVFAKKNDEALVQFKKYLAIDQSKFPIWNQVISLYVDKQVMDSVLHYSNKSIEIFPNNPIPYFFKGIAYVQLKQSENAIKPFNKSLELEPENPALVAQVYSSLGDVYNTQKQYVLSDSCFDKALKLQPDDATTLNNYAYYLSLRKSKLNDAERMSKKSLLLVPESKSFLDTYGWILYQQGKYNEAKEYIQKALKATGDDDATLLEHLGDIYFKLNDSEKAMELWKRAVKKEVENPILMKKISEGKMYE